MSFFSNRFDDKVMIVTGGASGIGKAVSLRAAKEGAKVVIVDINKESGSATEQEINSQGGCCLFIQTDLTKEEDVINMITSAVDRFKKLDILINNAGTSIPPKALHELETSDFERLMNINFYSTFYCSKHFIKQVITQNSGGAIVNTASIAGITGLPSSAPYVTSKHAINGLTKNLAIDYAPYGIRVNSINPYATDTPLERESKVWVQDSMNKLAESGVDLSKLVIPGYKSSNLINRTSTAEEQASSILYLASDEAAHITGSIFVTDGGYTTY